MKKTMTISLALGLATALMAQPNVPIGDMKAKLAKTAGEKGPFAKHEQFPKDYFLIPKNLPFLAGLTLHHPMSSTLGLSEEQIEKIKKIKHDTVPLVISSAKEVKTLELSLQKMIEEEVKSPEIEAVIDKIGALRIALTKKHLACIQAVRAILTKEQEAKVLAYAGKQMHTNSPKHPVDELVPLPHPVKSVLLHKEELAISKEQMQKIETEMLGVFPEKIHGSMDKAKALEEKIKEAVLKEGKTKEELQTDISALADLKITITNDHIDALDHLRTILSKEQFEKVLTLSHK